MSLEITGQTDVGQRRTDNQDTFICAPIWAEGSALLAVIDGVGGYAGGDQAAAIAQESISQYMTTPTGNPLSMLREAVVFANNQINTRRQQDRALAQMCCVLTVAVVDSQSRKLFFAHVGDTRLYRYRQGTLTKLTHDHSLVGVREDASELTEAEAMQHPRRNEILREVGSAAHRVDDPDFLESGEADFQPGDQLLLCSDGLTDMITQAQIRSVLDQKKALPEKASDLVRLANDAGGNDNITVVLATNTAQPSRQPSASQPRPDRMVAPAPLPTAATTPAPAPTASTRPQTGNRTGRWLVLGLLAAGVAGFLWYQNQAADPTGTAENASTPADSLTSGAPATELPPASPLDSLLRVAYQSADKRLVLPPDTIRLNSPLLLADSLQSIIGTERLTVLVPADTMRSAVALRILRAGPTRLENIVISGFKTGIETSRETKLQLVRVHFQQVDLPIRAEIRQDSFQNAVIQVSVQSQTDSPKPVRP
ncbi:serine/threonine protein phosphatase PrpC [Spirosoma lacussanchae]|uniref:PP2C family protein-serine/threonine phosphatase n=1 Tax=Spirosoma lacussanchae TaxID=1884249 RepID=UPI0011085763|nr:protein phosphatase 2C domain-containing protein [Spirosoma lacussanchae]